MSDKQRKSIFYVGKPYLKNENGKSRLNADIEAENDKFTLWYEIDEEYNQYLVTERCDSFVVALLPWVMMKAKKLQKTITLLCESIISAKLWHQLTNYYIPVLSRCVSYYGLIQIESKADSGILPYAMGGGVVGASVSGGLDSFYTMFKYKDNLLQNYCLTYVMNCNFGLYGGLNGESESIIKTKTQRIAQEAGLEYVHPSTNVIIELYGGAGHGPIVPAALTSVVLALQKLFAVYYYSSAVPIWDFSINDVQAHEYDLLNTHCLSTENTHFYLSGLEVTRLDKAAYTANIPIVQNNLLVCETQNNGKNCSICANCTRTMAEFEVLGKLDAFSKVFDVTTFRKKNSYYWGYLLLKSKGGEHFAKETVDLYLKTCGHFSIKIYWAAFTKWVKRGFTTSNKKRRKVVDEIR
jgi:hypothetical protein